MHVMVDLETMSTRKNAVIVTFGAIKFNPAGDNRLLMAEYPKCVEDIEAVTDSFYRRISWQGLSKQGFHLDPSTASWWMKRKEEERYEVIAADNRHLLDQVMIEFYLWFGNSENIWSHGAGFDCSIIEEACAILGKKCPFFFTKVRDTRTLYDLADIDAKSFRGGKAHHALFDCWDQALAAQKAYRRLGYVSKS